MVAKIFYTKKPPQEHDVDNFAKELERYRVEHELIEGDSAEGIRLMELYDLTSRPAVVLVRQDGTQVERWMGNLPLPADVSYLAHS